MQNNRLLKRNMSINARKRQMLCESKLLQSRQDYLKKTGVQSDAFRSTGRREVQSKMTYSNFTDAPLFYQSSGKGQAEAGKNPSRDFSIDDLLLLSYRSKQKRIDKLTELSKAQTVIRTATPM